MTFSEIRWQTAFTFGTASEQLEPDSRTCETEGSLCVTLKIPENLSETPERMVVALFRQLPPVGPPDVFPPFVLNSPELTPGQTFDVLVEANTTGTYHVYAVLYMPGGGATVGKPSLGQTSWVRPMPSIPSLG